MLLYMDFIKCRKSLCQTFGNIKSVGSLIRCIVQKCRKRYIRMVFADD